MTTDVIEREFREKVCSQVRLDQEGVGRFRVFTPFRFEDGDHLSIVLKHSNGTWVLSDEGHTFMHLTYDLDERALQRGTRQEIISNALSVFVVEDHHGELTLPVEQDAYGDALYSFVQALLKITDVTFLTRERVVSTFLEDFHAFLSETVPEDRRSFDWHDPVHDPDGVYPVDCRINAMPRPLFLYALPSDDRTRDATIALLRFENWGHRSRSVGVFENQEGINRKVLARFSDVADKQFSSLSGNRERIAGFLREAMALPA